MVTRYCKSNLSLGLHNNQGILEWSSFPDVVTLQTVLEKLANGLPYGNYSKHYGFSFIRCKKDIEELSNLDPDYAVVEEKEYAEQLLVLPPIFKDVEDKSQSKKQSINFNIVMIDSVSRQHFYRSLKKSVSFFEKLNKNNSSLASVIDFELVQSIKSRTFENLQAFFSGYVDPSKKTFGVQEIPPEPLNMTKLFRKLKTRGYQTLWLEDLCYLWEWGLPKDLHFLNLSSSHQETWKRMWSRLSQNFIDSVDVTLAMCKIFDACGVKDGFHSPNPICFNGRHQHEYLFEYLSLYQKKLNSLGQPWFTFTMTNVGHEETGRRIQTLDSSLVNYLSLASSMPNTLTVLLSDHGNTYGEFLKRTQEGEVEKFNPFLFFIIPRYLGQQLGMSRMRALGLNSKHLITWLDLHYTLRHLISPRSRVSKKSRSFNVSNRGLFSPVSSQRTCNHLPLIPPNTCICEDFEQKVTSSLGQELLAFFAVDQLNAEIQRQFSLSHNFTLEKGFYEKKSSSSKTWSAFGNCEKLTFVGFDNVRTSIDKVSKYNIKLMLYIHFCLSV